ncbi:hypothetical protein UVI_02028690 [Ustilaginoidea virens]|nr:hypothetical protein UVI_02028690 [Ustilaginoidea virens]
MDDMDIRGSNEHASGEEESRIYNAALDEAAELVWQHQNGYKPPQPGGPYRYRPHLRKNSYAHARTASSGKYGDGIAPSGLRRDPASRSVSGSSTDSSGSLPGNRESCETARITTRPSRKSKPYGNVGNAPHHRLHSSLRRNISGETQRPFSADQIWEEPEAAASIESLPGGRASPDKLSSKPQNPLNQSPALPIDCNNGLPGKPLNRFEIHHNPPSQSRNPHYTTNSQHPSVRQEAELERKNGIEIRSDDIRAATSRKLKDRSCKLPEPTAVSDRPGRPIVSFDTNWKAPEETTDSSPDRPSKTTSFKTQEQSRHQPPEPVAVPCINVTEVDPPRARSTPSASVPSISVAGSDDAPSDKNIPTVSMPTISLNKGAAAPAKDTSAVSASGAKPTGSSRPLPSPASSTNQQGGVQTSRRQHWSPAAGSLGRPTATCHECGFPIEGRFVALRGTQERFHPQCFSCFSCGTSLEAMEISPEPDLMRTARLERIRRRAAGEMLEDLPGMTMEEDGDERLRFYCHLDWHELFAPRCKHCKTPIIGEHIVALGEHWHYGHFFCAECGDPFEHGTTHIEKDGYAWCIKCQTRRTERRAPKCKMCKIAVIGQYIRALGGEWHEHCFRCAECEGGFVDGQIFTKEVKGVMVVLCTDCRTRDLKA